MHLELAPNEAAILRNILEHYLGELRMEIAGTERLAWREPMHAEEDVIKSLLMRLPAESGAQSESRAQGQGDPR